MTHRSLSTPNSALRVFSACLLSALMIMMPFVQLAAAEQRSVARSQRSEPQGAEVKDQSSNATAENLFVNPPAAVGITATKSDAYPSSPGPAVPGEVITYTVDVANPNPPGNNATGVTFTDIIDPQTTRFGADFDLKVSPLAINDTYAAEQNVTLNVSAPGVLTNDTGVPAPTATAIVAGPTTAGGTVTLNTDGSFSYTPINAGFTGADTFTYTITNGNAPPNPGVDNLATVTINVDAAPTVQSTTPADNATDQAGSTDITVTFSEAVNATASSFTISCATSGTHTFALSGGTTTYTLNPNTDFSAGEICTVTVVAAQVTDVDTNDPPNNMAADYVFDFTIDQAPSVQSTTPTNGATGVPTNSDITLTFSESVSLTAAPVTISCATSGVHTFTVSGSPNTTFTINPTDFVQNELCTVTVLANQVSDTDTNDPPNNMLGDYVFSFTTDAAPAVTTTSPTNGATNIPTNATITVNFTENVNATTNSFKIECPAPGNLQTFTLSASPSNTFTLTPTALLPAGVTCTVTVIAAQITDQDGNDPPDNMTGDHAFSFSTDAAPTVTTTVPITGANPVATNTNITVNFSEAVNVTTSSFTIECPNPGNLQAFTVGGSGTSSITLDPTADLPAGTLCTVTVVANQVSDADANDPPDTMVTNFVFSFTTDSPPSVTTTVPADNATNVALGATITVNFSESVAATGSSFTIVCTNAGTRAFTLSASPSTSFVLTPTGGLPAGDDCTVTVVANQITDTDTTDPPDNMVADHVFDFKVQPDAVNDTYPVTLVGNVSTNSFLIPYSVTTNDVSAATFTISAVQANSTIVTNTITTTSTNGGNIVMTVSGADRGKFTYDPPAGFEGTDTFNYTITRTDGGGTDTATVSMPISGMVWFINNNATSCVVAGCGRLSNPFSTLAAFNTLNNGTGNNPAASDDIFVYESATGYTGAVTLLNGQRFIGQDATATLSAITGLTPPSGSPSFPAMNTGAPTTNITSTVTMETNSTVRGLSINVTGTSNGLVASGKTGLVVTDVATISVVNTPGVAASFTSSSGTFTFTNISASGTGAGLNFASTTSGSTVNINNITTDDGAAFTTSSTGTTDFTVNDVISTGGTAVSVTTSTGDFIFHEINSNGGAKGITVNSATGSFTVNGDGTTDGSGGTVQNATSRGGEFISSNNITLKNMNFTSNGVGGNDLNCGDALGASITTSFVTGANCESNVHLQSTTTVVLNNVNANDGDAHGINGVAVNGLTLTNVEAQRNGSMVGEDGVQLVNQAGTVSVTGGTFKDNASRSFEVQNNSGSPTITMTSNAFGNTNFPTAGGTAPSPSNSTAAGAVLLATNGGSGAFITSVVTGCTFTNVYGIAFFIDMADGNNRQNVTFGQAGAGNGNTITTASQGISVVGTNDVTPPTKALTASVVNNTLTNDETVMDTFSSTNINFRRGGGGGAASGDWDATIDNNNVGINGNSKSGCETVLCFGISADDQGSTSGTFTVLIQNNDVYNVGGGIQVAQANAGAHTIRGTVINNVVQQPDPAPSGGAGGTEGNGIYVNSGTNATGTFYAKIEDNDVDGGWDFVGNQDSIRVRHAGAAGSQFFLCNFVLASSSANVATHLANENPLSSAPAGFTVTGASIGAGLTVANGCPLVIAEGGVEADSDFALFANLAFGYDANASMALSQSQLDSTVAAAMDRWAATGLNAKQIAAMRAMKFEVGDLANTFLGTATGNHITVDRDAQGKGWFIDTTPADDLEFGDRSSATRRYTNPYTAAAGRVDLLTAIEHEIGHKLGLDDSYAEKDRDSIMYGYLTVGERRLPARGEAANAQADSLAGTHFLKLNKPEVRGQRPEGSKQKAVSRKNHAATTRALAPVSGEPLNYTIGDLPAGKSVRITFKVTVDSPFSGTQVSNQGSVSGTLNVTPFGPVVTDDPDTGAPNDATVTPVQGPPDAVDDAYTSFKNTTLNIAAPGVLTNDTNVTSVTAVNGSGANVGISVNTSPAATGTVTVNSDGSFTYTPPNATFTGGASFTYEATGTSPDTATVNITVVDTSAIYINEVLFDPPGSDAPNEYIEVRGPASGVIPAGTYLVAIEGDAADNPGNVTTIINLSGLSFGSNGFLVLLQMSNTYVPAAGATVVTSTTVGFGGLPGGIWSADASATDLPDASTTFMLIQTGTVPTLTDDIDSANDGGFDGTVYPGWNVRDSISAMNGSANAQAYGAFSFRNTAGTGTGQGGEVIVPFIPSYVGRICDSTGSTATDWLSSGVLGGLAPNWTLGSSTETEPSSFAGNPLDHIGTTNFVNTAPVNTVPGAQITGEDTALVFTGATQISIADSDAGSNSVEVTLTATNGTMTLSGTAGLTFTPPGAGNDGTNDVTMIFTGTVTAINTALNNLTFTPTSNYAGAASVQIQTNDQGNTGGAACSTTQSDTDTVNITVSATNDAPVLDNTGNMALNSIPQDVPAASNPGTLVSDIILSAGGDRITDVDAGAVEGIAVNAVNNTNGTWEFSTNGGGVWTAFGSPTDVTARLLASDANTRVRFQPNLGFSGTVSPGITFRAWDQTSGTNGATGDASVNGGATAFSTATETASITVSSTVSIQDAVVAEPSTGTANMVFTVTLDAPAAPGGAAVNFTTADEPAGPGKAVAGVCGSGGDYVLTSGTVNFAAGQQVKTINVPVCADGTVEPDETFLVNLSSPVNATIADGTATGTIKSTNPAGAVLISELRTSGPGGAGDDFVEIYNNTNSPLTVAASDASAGYGLYKMGADCNATPILIGVIPNGTVIPARGHYLFVGSAYSLANYGGSGAAAGNLLLTADIETDGNVGLFSTSNIAGISSVNRLDAVGFGANTGGACDLLREGSTLPPIAGNATIEHSYFRKMCDWIQGSGCTVPGVPKDTNDNSVDFWLADTAGSAITGRLGAPGPENLASPIRRDSANNPGSGGISVFLLDGTVGSAAGANRDRNGSEGAGSTPTQFGTMTLRYRVTNNTGANVTRLRYRIVDISTAIQPAGPTADLRALTSSIESSPADFPQVHDSVTCAAANGGNPATPCNVTVQATTLEQPPTQTIGGGYNSTLSSDTVTITPLPNGQSILINFKLGVQKTGTFRFYIIVEALP